MQRQETIDLFGNFVSFLSGLTTLQAKALQSCDFLRLVFEKLKFSNTSNHYFNPPDYLVIEPENTDERTSNLQQTNTNGYKFQDSENAFEEAKKFINRNKILKGTYSLDDGFQMKLRELFGRYKYRLDTNYAKIDRIQHFAIENFKAEIMDTKFCGLSILEWSKIIASADKIESQKILKEKLGI